MKIAKKSASGLDYSLGKLHKKGGLPQELMLGKALGRVCVRCSFGSNPFRIG
jgi:hypothetical protein